MTVVRKFHEAFGLAALDTPGFQPDDQTRLRMRLIEEEYDEVMAELSKLLRATDYGAYLGTLARLLKELCDLRYVVEGTAVAYGLPIDDAYLEVHKSNMSKLGPEGLPIVRGDGKVLKGPGYFPANMEQFVVVVEGDTE